MAASRDELDAMLGALEADLPRLIRDNPQVADFCIAFIAEADVIEARVADSADIAHVRSRIDHMLARHGTSRSSGN